MQSHLGTSRIELRSCDLAIEVLIDWMIDHLETLNAD